MSSLRLTRSLDCRREASDSDNGSFVDARRTCGSGLFQLLFVVPPFAGCVIHQDLCLTSASVKTSDAEQLVEVNNETMTRKRMRKVDEPGEEVGERVVDLN